MPKKSHINKHKMSLILYEKIKKRSKNVFTGNVIEKLGYMQGF